MAVLIGHRRCNRAITAFALGEKASQVTD